MSTRKLVFVIMLLTLAVPNHLGIVLAAPRRAVRDWKMPLPSGEYEVPQGDQDSCYDTHCKGYAYGNQNTYCAIDLFVSGIAGMPVLAPADGKVIDVGYQAVGGGNYVYILHDDGFVSHYEHLQKVYVERNARLKQGQPFARVGATGSSGRRAWQEHLHFTVKTERNGACVKLSSLDGNTDFKTNATVKSSNVQVGTLPDDLPAPIPSAPPVTPPTTSSGGPNPWDVSWLPGDHQQVIAAIDAIITSPETGGSLNAGLKGYGETILNYALASIEQNPAGVNPAFALAMFRKEANFATNGAAAANNNPGNIICAGGTKPLYGAIRCNGRFGVYASMGDGIKAYFWLLQYEYKPGGGKSRNCADIACIIGYYAPSSENNTQQYIDQVTAWTRDFQNRIVNGMQPPSSGKPDNPMLANPGNGSSMVQSTDVTLRWSSATNAIQYKVELWGGPYSTMTPCDWQSGTSCQIGTMNPGMMEWHVKARNASGQESEWSDTWTFTVQGPTEIPPTKTSTPLPQAPGAPALQDPSNGSSYSQSQDIWFAWNYVSGADQYYLEYWGGPYGTLNSGWITDVAYHIGTMWPGAYKWHVKSRGQNGVESNWSDTWSFTVTQSATSIPPSSIPPTAVPPTQIPPTAVPQPPTAKPQPSFTGNIAPQANRSPDGIGSSNAFDGDLSTFWIDGLGHAFSLELRLPDPLQVNRILVWDRPQNSPDNNQINALIIRLSNGMEGRFGMDSQGARCIDVTLSSPQTISSVTLKADDASGNNGLSEVEIWVGSKTGGPNCSNSGTMP